MRSVSVQILAAGLNRDFGFQQDVQNMNGDTRVAKSAVQEFHKNVFCRSAPDSTNSDSMMQKPHQSAIVLQVMSTSQFMRMNYLPFSHLLPTRSLSSA